VFFVRQAFFAPPDWRLPRIFVRVTPWHSLKPHLYSSLTNFSTWEGEKGGEEGEEGENGRRGQLSQTCSRNNRWLLNRKHTRFLWGRRYRYENALAFRKRTTCLVSSVSFVSRFLPVNKPGLHPPAAARHPPSKHKARWLVVSRCRKAWRYSFAVSPFLSFSHFLSLSLSFVVAILILFSHLHVTTASYALIYVATPYLLFFSNIHYILHFTQRRRHVYLAKFAERL